jgi:type IX secretion system PorP/SprF family membrane protein
MKKTTTFCLLLTAFMPSFSQDILYNNANFNLLALNPAFAGARKEFSLTGLFGNQFNGTITPQQVSQVLSLDGQTGTHSNGLGLQAFNNGLANQNQQGVLVDYAYRMPIPDIGNLSFGFRAGFTYQSGFVTTTNGPSRFFPYAGFGALFHADNFFVSLSKPVLFSKEAIYQNINQKPLFAAAGYSFVPAENILLNPSIIYEQNDINGNAISFAAKLWLATKFGFGASLKNRSESAYNNAYTKIIGTFEIQASKSIRVGISYDDKPYSDYFLNTTTFAPGGLLQLFFRYEATSEREGTNRLKFF